MSWIQADLTGLQQLVSRFGGMKPLLMVDIQNYLVKDAGPRLQRQAVQNVSGVPFPRARNTSPPVIQKRTGTLSRGIEYETPYQGMPTSLRLYADARTYGGVNYAKALHDGAVIRPKNGRFLIFRVPITGARMTDYRRLSRWAWHAAYRNGLNPTNSVLIFARQVVIPARPFLLDAWEQNEERITGDLQRIIIERLEGKQQ